MSKNRNPRDIAKTDVRRYDDNAQIAQAAVSFIRSLVTSCGLVPREITGPDLGIDMLIEDPTLRGQDNQDEAARFILAQIKGTVQEQWKYSIRVEKAREHFKYWRSCAIPVVLIQVKVNCKEDTKEPWYPHGTCAIGVFITKELKRKKSTVSWRDCGNIVEMHPITMKNPKKSAKMFHEFIENTRTKKFPSWTQALERAIEELLNAGDHRGALTLLAPHTHPDAIVLSQKVWRRTVNSKKKWDQKSRERTRKLTKIGTDKKFSRETRSKAYRELAYGNIHSGLKCGISKGLALKRFTTANKKRINIVKMDKHLKHEELWECLNHGLYADLMLDWMQRSWPVPFRDIAGLARRASNLFACAKEDHFARADGLFTAWRTWLFLADGDVRRQEKWLSYARDAERLLGELFAKRGSPHVRQRLRQHGGNSAGRIVSRENMLNPQSYADFLLMKSFAHVIAGHHEKASTLFGAAERALHGFMWYPELEPWLKRVGARIKSCARSLGEHNPWLEKDAADRASHPKR
jgi:hypothetical protein